MSSDCPKKSSNFAIKLQLYTTNCVYGRVETFKDPELQRLLILCLNLIQPPHFVLYQLPHKWLLQWLILSNRYSSLCAAAFTLLYYCCICPYRNYCLSVLGRNTSQMLVIPTTMIISLRSRLGPFLLSCKN